MRGYSILRFYKKEKKMIIVVEMPRGVFDKSHERRYSLIYEYEHESRRFF